MFFKNLPCRDSAPIMMVGEYACVYCRGYDFTSIFIYILSSTAL